MSGPKETLLSDLSPVESAEMPHVEFQVPIEQPVFEQREPANSLPPQQVPKYTADHEVMQNNHRIVDQYQDSSFIANDVYRNGSSGDNRGQHLGKGNNNNATTNWSIFDNLRNTETKELLLLFTLMYALQQSSFLVWVSNYLPMSVKEDDTMRVFLTTVGMVLGFYISKEYI